MYIWNYVFNYLMEKYWDSKYRSVPVFMKDLSGEMLGEYECTPEGFNCIHLASNQNLSNEQLLGVLLHEMCHHVVFEKYGIDVDPHGKEWVEEMRNVGFSGEITELTDGMYKFSLEEFDEILRLISIAMPQQGETIH